MFSDYTIAQWILKALQIGFLIKSALVGGEQSFYAFGWAILIQLWIMEG